MRMSTTEKRRKGERMEEERSTFFKVLVVRRDCTARYAHRQAGKEREKARRGEREREVKVFK